MNNELSIEYITKQLLNAAQLISARDAESIVPSATGLYSIFINGAKYLPNPFNKYLLQKNTLMIYLGKASHRSFIKRLVEEDLRHKRASTFVRSLGCILGYLPIFGSLINKKNKYNFKFNQDDTQSIINWINNYLSIRWIKMTKEEAIFYEPLVINKLRPLLNITHNPDALPELLALRKKSRDWSQGLE